MVYLLQGAIWGEGTIISQCILMLLIGWSWIVFCKVIIHPTYLPKSLKVLAILLISYVLYGLFAMMGGETLYVSHSGTPIPPFSYIKQALVSILPLYVFYNFSLKNKISIKSLCLLSIVFFVVITITYYTNQSKLLRLALERGSLAREFTNNLSYGFIYLIPYLYFFKNKKVAIFFLVAISISLLLGMKRGAILIGAVGIIFYIQDFFKDTAARQKIVWFIAVLIVLIFIGYYIAELYEESPYFRQRVESTIEGSTSGRNEITESLMTYFWEEANILQQIFGSGANATLRHSVNFAHNDWFEMLIDQGFVGLILLLYFYFTLWRETKLLRLYNIRFARAFRTLFYITFLKTFFSMSICNMLPYLTLIMGFLLSQITILEIQRNVKRISFNIGHNTGVQCGEVSAKMR